MRKTAAALLQLCLLSAAFFLALAPAQAQTPPAAAGLAAPGFRELDANADGRVSLEEVLAYAKKSSSLAQPFRVADVDADGDGLLSQEELRKAGVRGLEGGGVIRARDLDLNGDGYVSREELDEYFRRKHREAFARADQDKDGWLREPEFTLLRF